MKNSIKTFATIFALIATFSFANAEDKENKKAASFGTGIYATNAGQINVMVDKANKDASTVIQVTDEHGTVMYREIVGKKVQKFGRSLNVDELKEGNYTIEVQSNGEKQTKTFKLAQPAAQRTLQVK